MYEEHPGRLHILIYD